MRNFKWSFQPFWVVFVLVYHNHSMLVLACFYIQIQVLHAVAGHLLAPSCEVFIEARAYLTRLAEFSINWKTELDWIDQGLKSHLTHFRSFLRRWGWLRHQPGLYQSQPTVCVVLSSVCATTVDNSGVYVYYLKGIVSVSSGTFKPERNDLSQYREDTGTGHNVLCLSENLIT